MAKKKVIDPRNKSQFRHDGWSNLVTSLGTSMDKRNASRINWEHHDPEFYEQMYAGGGIPARIVDLIPEESLRHWVEWLNVEKEVAETIDDACEQLDVRGALLKSWKWGRAYGGACLHIVTDTRDPASPLKKGERVIGFRDLSRWDLRILTTDVEYDFGSPNWGHPRIYYLNVQMGSQYKGYPIHWTRMIRFDGQLVPRRTYIRNNYWHDSILNRLFNSIRNYETANDSAAACLMDFNVDVFKMKNLANLMQSSEGEEIVRNRIEMLAYSKSVINSMIIDSDEEDYENKGRTLQGVAELLVHQANRLVAETDIPHTKLLGESPEGSNSTGNSTSQQWYNFIGTEQENYLRPRLKRIIEILFPNIPNLDFKFKSLRVLDDMEKSDLRLKVAQADKEYIDAGVLDPSEIAMSRFGGDEWSMETDLDMEGRKNGSVVPGQQAMEGEGDEAFNTSGDEPPEGKSSVKSEPGPSAPEPKPTKGKEEKQTKVNQAADLKKDDEAGPDSVEGHGLGEAFGINGGRPSTEFDLKNNLIEVPGGREPEKTFISQTMSEPMRDPRTDPIMKGPGVPNKARVILPTRGTGLMAPSGFDFERDAGAQDVPREGVEPDARVDVGVEATMKEFAKGTLKSSSGKKVTDPKQAAAIGYSEERAQKDEGEDEPPPSDDPNPVATSVKGALGGIKGDGSPEPARKRAATIILKKGDKFAMGKDSENNRYTLPGGWVNDDESMHQGAIRELNEEAGVQAKKLKFLGSRLVESKMGAPVEVAIYEFNCDESAKVHGRNDPDKEVSKWEWFSHKEPLHKDVLGNLKHPNNVALDHMGLLK